MRVLVWCIVVGVCWIVRCLIWEFRADMTLRSNNLHIHLGEKEAAGIDNLGVLRWQEEGQVGWRGSWVLSKISDVNGEEGVGGGGIFLIYLKNHYSHSGYLVYGKRPHLHISYATLSRSLLPRVGGWLTQRVWWLCRVVEVVKGPRE